MELTDLRKKINGIDDRSFRFLPNGCRRPEVAEYKR